MKFHSQFSPKQRNGIFVLLLIIACLQAFYVFVDFSEEHIQITDTELERYKTEVDTLQAAKVKQHQFKIYPFNPNFITDYKGYTLGMSTIQIDRLHAFRQKDKWVNSALQFQKVTGVSDSLLAQLKPYFKFPEWVSNPQSKPQYTTYSNSKTPKTYPEKQDLNTATAQQLQRVYGIGKKLSQRIVAYRDKFEGGFIADVELSEVWGVSTEVIERITAQFTVKTPRKISKINLNTANSAALVTIPHIDYEIAANIIEERLLREGFTSVDDLAKVEGFPILKIEIIKLYLHI